MRRKRMHGKKRSVLQQSPDSIIPKYKDIIQSEKETVSKPTRYFHSQLENISQRRLDLPYLNYNAEHSAFFKHHYLSNWTNRGLMVREID